MAPRTGLWAVRILVAGVALAALAGWSAAAQSPQASPRVAIIGDSNAGADSVTLAHALVKSWFGSAPLRLKDYSQPGAGVDEITQLQLGPLIEGGADLVLLRLGPAGVDADGPEDTEHAVVRFSSLLAAVMTRTRARVIVSTVPRSAIASAGDRLTDIHRMRQIELYNDGVEAMAARAGATIVPGDAPAGARVWRAAVDAALGRGPDGTASTRSTSIALTSAMIPALRERARMGRAAGQRSQVLVKVGDSMTAAPEFLAAIITDGRHAAATELDTTAAYFNGTPAAAGATGADDADEVRNGAAERTDASELIDRAPADADVATSFRRQSLAARARWAAADVLAGGPHSALARELAATRPAVAVVMFGTNDLTRATVDEFEEAMDRLLAELQLNSVIPLLSTIPMRTDRADYSARVPVFNASIRALAEVHGVPLIDYGGAMLDLPTFGLSDDGIHPSVCPDGPEVLTPDCLRYGYNLRNLLTLQALDMLRRLVLIPIDNEAADE